MDRQRDRCRSAFEKTLFSIAQLDPSSHRQRRVGNISKQRSPGSLSSSASVASWGSTPRTPSGRAASAGYRDDAQNRLPSYCAGIAIAATLDWLEYRNNTYKQALGYVSMFAGGRQSDEHTGGPSFA